MEIQKIKKEIAELLTDKTLSEKINYINELREAIHNESPFKNEPVDYVKWVLAEDVIANDYNPNKVAPPEMELLEISIMNDGYTQPVVTFPNNGKIEVVDGFHRTRVSKESKIVRERVLGYTPTVIIRKEQSNKNDRIASTIRHNRARGKHQVDAMSEIILELKNRNWKNERIARELGMDQEEILRLCQITGLQDIFKDDDFSKSWESSDSIANYEILTDDLSDEEVEHYRTTNTSDPDRIFHTFEKWECHKAGFYGNKKLSNGMYVNLYDLSGLIEIQKIFTYISVLVTVYEVIIPYTSIDELFASPNCNIFILVPRLMLLTKDDIFALEFVLCIKI
jgi:ParB-like chromosome segregation protein Spo0J